MTRIYNRASELEKRRLLRGRMTEAEEVLWSRIKGRQLNGVKFRRQHSIGPYIVDFYNTGARLAIELDGNVHNSEAAIEYDRYRGQFIESIGIRILRFKNDEVLFDLNGVIQRIEMELDSAFDTRTFSS